MKKVLIAVLLFAGIAAFAQGQNSNDRQQREKLSPQQRNELMLKKMTLDLGLNESQQKDMAKIISEQNAKREAAMAKRKDNKSAGTKPSADERYQVQNERLDDQIAMKEKVRKILTPDQFKKWEQMKEDRKGKMHDRKEKRKMKNPKTE